MDFVELLQPNTQGGDFMKLLVTYLLMMVIILIIVLIMMITLGPSFFYVTMTMIIGEY